MKTTLAKLKAPIKITLQVIKPYEIGTEAEIRVEKSRALMKRKEIPSYEIGPPIVPTHVARSLEELSPDEWRVVAYLERDTRENRYWNTGYSWWQSGKWRLFVRVLEREILANWVAEGRALTVQKTQGTKTFLLAKLPKVTQ